MAAIAGIVPRVRGCRRDTLTRVVIAMRDAMARRAPLEGGVAVAYDASIALAHRGGGGPGGDCVLQPLRNETGTLWLVADGEPTNAAELRLELIGDGHRFVSGSGGEVILHLYEQHGIAGIERLAGGFAFALWDREHHELVLGRDRFGEKPLYVSDAADRFSFASEVQALAPLGELDPASVAAFLTLGYVPEPRTILRGVRAVEPGTLLRVRGGRARVQSFWEDRWIDERADGDTGSVRLGYLLRAAAQGAVDREEHAGVLLDGGIETVALLALTRPSLGSGGRSHAVTFADAADTASSSVPTGRRTDGGGPRAVAAWFQSEYREHAVGPAEVAAAFDAGAETDQPSAGAALAHLGAALLRASGERVWLSALAPPVLFDAEGASTDTWGQRAVRQAAARLALRAGAPLAVHLRPFAATAKLWTYAAAAHRAAGAYLGVHAALAPPALGRVLRPELLGAALNDLDLLAHLDATATQPIGPVLVPPPPSPRAALRRALAALYLRGPLMCGALRDQDAAACAHELALRTPFLDHRLFEWLSAASPRERGVGVLRALDAAMPARLGRPRAVVSWPIASWLSAELRSFIEPHVVAADADGVFAGDGLQALWREFLAGRADSRVIWTLATLRAWLTAWRRNATRTATGAPATTLRLDAA